MEALTPDTPDNADGNSTIDDSRPFHSVKEAVAIFGKRIFIGGIQPPLKPSPAAVGKVESPAWSEPTSCPEKPCNFAVRKVTSFSAEFTPGPAKPPGVAVGKVESPESSESISSPSNYAVRNVKSPAVSEFIQTPGKPSNSTVDKVTPTTSSEFTPISEKASSFAVQKTTTPSPEFTANQGLGIGKITSPTYELKLSPENPLSSTMANVRSTSHELAPTFEKAPNSAIEKVSSPSFSEKSQSSAIENGISDSSEIIQSPNKHSLSNTSKEAVILSDYEPTTPSPQISKTQITLYPSPNFSWEKGISAPPTPSISSKEIEPTPSPENLRNDTHGKVVHGNDLVMMLMILKRLESELQETKMELKLLKERESETEVALATLNAELHKSMSKIAKAEAAEAATAAAKSATLIEEGYRKTSSRSRSSRDRPEEGRECEVMPVMVKDMDSPTLAQILSITDYDCYFQDSKNMKKNMKKKPIIPLFTDIFPWKKRSPQANTYHSAPLFSW